MFRIDSCDLFFDRLFVSEQYVIKNELNTRRHLIFVLFCTHAFWKLRRPPFDSAFVRFSLVIFSFVLCIKKERKKRYGTTGAIRAMFLSLSGQRNPEPRNPYSHSTGIVRPIRDVLHRMTINNRKRHCCEARRVFARCACIIIISESGGVASFPERWMSMVTK